MQSDGRTGFIFNPCLHAPRAKEQRPTNKNTILGYNRKPLVLPATVALETAPVEFPEIFIVIPRCFFQVCPGDPRSRVHPRQEDLAQGPEAVEYISDQLGGDQARRLWDRQGQEIFLETTLDFASSNRIISSFSNIALDAGTTVV